MMVCDHRQMAKCSLLYPDLHIYFLYDSDAVNTSALVGWRFHGRHICANRADSRQVVRHILFDCELFHCLIENNQQQLLKMSSVHNRLPFLYSRCCTDE